MAELLISLVSLSVLGRSAYYVLGTPTIAAILLPFQGLVKVFHTPPLPTNAGQPIAVRADRLFPRLRLVMSEDVAHALFVPAWRTCGLLRCLPFRRRRRRGDARAVPKASQGLADVTHRSTMNPRDCRLLSRADLRHRCKSSSCSHPCGPAILGQSGCHSDLLTVERLPTNPRG